MDPVKAPTQPIALPCKLDRPFCFKLLLATSSPQNPAQKFNRSQLVAYDEQGNPIQINGRVKLITGHLIRSVGSHVLFMKGVFNQTSGYLDVEATFDNFFRNLAPDLQSKYSVDEFRMTFGGVRFFGSCGNGWLGQRYLMEFSCHIRQLSNAFYTKHPQILRTGTINNDDGSTPSALDRPSKMLFVADDLTYQHIISQQEEYMVYGNREELVQHRVALQTKIQAMQRRTLAAQAVFGYKWKALPDLVQQFLGSGFEGNKQYFNLNFTHSPVSPHFDKAGFAGTNDFSGAGRSIATMRLEGGPVHIILQELPSRAQNRFPVAIYFTADNFETWGLTGNARFLTNHGVYPLTVPSMGATDPQPHSIHCTGYVGCNMSLTFTYGDVSQAEWQS